MLTAWLDNIVSLYHTRILAVDLPAARCRGRLSVTIGHESADLLIGGTALEHGLTDVTHNVHDFKPTGGAGAGLLEAAGMKEGMNPSWLAPKGVESTAITDSCG